MVFNVLNFCILVSCYEFIFKLFCFSQQYVCEIYHFNMYRSYLLVFTAIWLFPCLNLPPFIHPFSHYFQQFSHCFQLGELQTMLFLNSLITVSFAQLQVSTSVFLVSLARCWCELQWRRGRGKEAGPSGEWGGGMGS